MIAASAKEQALGLNQVNTAVSQMDQVTQQNAAMVEEATAATRTLQQQTEELNGLVGRFHTSAGVTALRDAGRRMAAAGERHGARKSLAKGHGGIEQSSGAPAARARASGNWEEF